ncbi:MAG: CCA tRNA nucleotidyltransferase [Phycisphaerales bacterium]
MTRGSSIAREVATWIVQTLREHGHVAYFAGGCVRDELLGLQPKDFDVATDARPEKIGSLFPRTAHVGAAFGVMLVRHQGVTVEVATFRADGTYTDRRRPDQVTFADELADARRRDFTVNALFLDPLKDISSADRVVDHVGGVADLGARVLRAVGDADQRLREDDLRALRAVRLSTRLGFTIEESTREAIRRHAGELSGISRERIGEEIRLMLAHETRAQAISTLGALALDTPTFGRVARAVPGHSLAKLRIPKNPDCGLIAGTLAAVLMDREEDLLVEDSAAGEGRRLEVLRETRQALCLSNEERDDCLAILKLLSLLRREWEWAGEARRKRAAASRGFAWANELFRTVDASRAASVDRVVDELGRRHGGIRPEALVTGDDLVAAGLSPGPAFRTVLERVYDAQLEGRITEKAGGMMLARELFGNAGV